MVLRGKAFSGRCLSGQPHHEGSCFLASLGSCIFREQGLALLASVSPSAETTAWGRRSGWEPLLDGGNRPTASQCGDPTL